MKWLEETHGTGFELVRHFLARMLDGEWSSVPGQWQRTAVSAIALFLPAGLLLLRSGSPDAGRYRHLSRLSSPDQFHAAALADVIGLLTLMFAVTGLLAMLEWQSLFPSRRDYLALAGLPVGSRQIFAARFCSVLIFSVLLVVALNILPSVVAPFEASGRWQKHGSFAAGVRAVALASGLGCLFVLFSIVAIQGVLLNAVPGRYFGLVSAYVQSALTTVLLVAGLYSWSIRNWTADTIRGLPELVAWAPPVWFAGLHESLLGSADPFFAEMARRSWWAAGLALAMAACTYLISYRRYRKLLLEAPIDTDSTRERRWSPVRLLAREPESQAVLEFMARTLARSRTHKVIWLVYIGAALGILLNSSVIDGAFQSRSAHAALEFLVLFWPIGLCCILISGIRHVLSIPSELAANWIFRLTEAQGRRQWMTAVERFVVAYAIAPVYLLSLPVATVVLGWPIASRMTLLQALVSMIAFELWFYSWQQLPFACSYLPGKRPLVAVVGGYIAVLGFAAPVLALMVAAASRFNELTAFYTVMFSAVWIWARRRRKDGWGDARLLYEDLPAVVFDIGIKEVSYDYFDRNRSVSPADTARGYPGVPGCAT